MKKLLAFFVLLLFKTVALAQVPTPDSLTKYDQGRFSAKTERKILAVGTASLGFPAGSLANIAKTALYFSSGFEFRATKHVTFVGISEFWTAQVELPTTADQPFVVRGRSNNVFLSANAGYYQSGRRWTVYGFGGLGVGLISRPSVDVSKAGTYDISAESKIKPVWRAGAGLEYRVSNTLVPYLETVYASTFTNTALGNTKFSYVSIGLGIKAYLKLKGMFNPN